MRHFGDPRCLFDVLLQWLARPVKHDRSKAAIKRQLAFFQCVTVIEMGDDRHIRTLCKMAEHPAEYGKRRVLAA